VGDRKRCGSLNLDSLKGKKITRAEALQERAVEVVKLNIK
jgi:hypothetical protein